MARKAQGLSINMLVIIALAVFVVFIVLGFTTGGWTKFAGLFSASTTGTGSGEEGVRITCETHCTQYANALRPKIQQNDVWYNKLVGDTMNIDLDGNGILDSADTYHCVGVTGKRVDYGTLSQTGSSYSSCALTLPPKCTDVTTEPACGSPCTKNNACSGTPISGSGNCNGATQSICTGVGGCTWGFSTCS